MLDIEARIGELFESMPAVTGSFGTAGRADLKSKGKIAAIVKMGMDDRKARRSVELHHNPDIVAKVKAKAREKGDIPTTGAVLSTISQEKEKESKRKADATREGRRSSPRYYFSTTASSRRGAHKGGPYPPLCVDSGYVPASLDDTSYSPGRRIMSTIAEDNDSECSAG